MKGVHKALAATAVAVAALVVASVLPAYPAVVVTRATVLGADASSAIPGRYIVVLKETGSLRGEAVSDQAAMLSQRYRGTLGHVYKTALKGFSVGMSEDQARSLAADPAVDYVEQAQLMRAAGTQDSPPSWGLDRIDQRGLPLNDTYNFDIGGDAVTVYVIDTGINFDHLDLRGRVVSGRDFVDGDENAADCHGHGTQVAGIIGGRLFGVAKDARMVSVRVGDCGGGASGETIVAAIDDVSAVATGPSVVNFSMGTDCKDQTGRPVPCPPNSDRAVTAAINRSMSFGIHWVVSAGNIDADACNRPAVAARGTIAVGSSTNADARSSTSNWGPCVDLFAPGQSVVSAHYRPGAGNDAVATVTGTSYAAPHVTGVVVRILRQPGWGGRSPADVANELLTNWVTLDRLTDVKGSPNKLLHNNPPLVAGGSSIAAARNGDGRLDLYGITLDGKLVQRTQAAPNATTWSAWATAGTTGWYAIGAHNDRNLHIELFGLQRRDGALWRRTKLSAAGTWTAWHQLDGAANAAAVATLPDGRVEAFVTNSQGQAFHRTQLTAGTRDFTAWEPFSLGAVQRGIAAETNGSGLIEVFTLTRTGQIWHRWQTSASATTYTDWVSLDGALTAMALTRRNNGGLVLFGVDAGGAVVQRTAQSGINVWSSWAQIPRAAEVGTLTSLAAETFADGRVALFGVNTAGQIWTTRQTQPEAETYTPWTQIDGTLRP